jgi:hypothetical protein
VALQVAEPGCSRLDHLLAEQNFKPTFLLVLNLETRNGEAMIYLEAASSSANTSFISQYGPLLAAAVALLGVLVTLHVNGKRDKERYRGQRRDDETRYRSQREDDYRREQRIAIADIAVVSQDFRRECGMLVNRDQWPGHRDLFEAATAALLNKLTVAMLLIHDQVLQKALDGVLTSWKSVGDSVDEVEGAFFNQQPGRQEAVASLEAALLRFDAETDILYTAALERLKPTVVEPSSQ